MAATSHNTEELQKLLNLHAIHGTAAAAADAINMPHSSFKDRLAAARKAGLKPTIKPAETMSGLRAQVKFLKSELKLAQTEADTAAVVREQIYDLAAVTPRPPKWLSPKKRSKSGERGCPMTLWSDWHYGEVVRKEEVAGVNEFNAEVAKDRVNKLVNTTIELCYDHMGDAKLDYPGIVVALGGDMISGDIHQELAESNDRTPHQAVNDLVDILAGALERMEGAFGKVYVPCVVGNHGRGTHKPRMKGRIFTSFEWNIYCMLERHFAGNPNVQFSIPEETDAYFSVYGHRFLLTHGDSLGVRGGDGIIGALGPIKRGSLKVAQSEAQIGRDFDTILMGHWHQYISIPGIIVNNSLKGYDEFSRLALRAPYSRPSQALWFVHPKHGITANWQVYLEPERRAVDKKKWVSVLG